MDTETGIDTHDAFTLSLCVSACITFRCEIVVHIPMIFHKYLSGPESGQETQRGPNPRALPSRSLPPAKIPVVLSVSSLHPPLLFFFLLKCGL